MCPTLAKFLSDDSEQFLINSARSLLRRFLHREPLHLSDTEGSSVMSAADRATLRDALRQMSSDSQPDLQAKAALLLIALQ